MVRTKEGGSILGFAVVGVILAVLLVGGVAAVRQNYINGQKATPASQKVAQSDKNKQAAQAPVESTAEQKPANEGAVSTESTSPTPAPVAREKEPVTATDLPHTGPMETLSAILAIGMLTASAVAYVRSRHYRLPSASI